MKTLKKKITKEEINNLDKYFRLANYLSVGQLYLLDNPLLKRPLDIKDIKPNVVGHWGTAPGQNFIYTHLQRIIKKYNLNMIYISGPGHGGQAMIANDYIDTLKLARLCLPDLGHHRLSNLAQYYGISTEGAHRALNDCRMNQQVFEQLAKEMDGSAGGKAKVKLCPICGQPMKKRNGRFGEFWGCSGFPGCRYTENI